MFSRRPRPEEVIRFDDLQKTLADEKGDPQLTFKDAYPDGVLVRVTDLEGQIAPNDFNPNKDGLTSDEMTQLVAALRRGSPTKRIIARPIRTPHGIIRLEILDGEHTWLALRRARQHETTVLVLAKDDVEAREETIQRNAVQGTVTAVTQAERKDDAKRLIQALQVIMSERGLTKKQLAELMGKSPQWLVMVEDNAELKLEKPKEVGGRQRLIDTPKLGELNTRLRKAGLSLNKSREVVRMAKFTPKAREQVEGILTDYERMIAAFKGKQHVEARKKKRREAKEALSKMIQAEEEIFKRAKALVAGGEVAIPKKESQAFAVLRARKELQVEDAPFPKASRWSWKGGTKPSWMEQLHDVSTRTERRLEYEAVEEARDKKLSQALASALDSYLGSVDEQYRVGDVKPFLRDFVGYLRSQGFIKLPPQLRTVS